MQQHRAQQELNAAIMKTLNDMQSKLTPQSSRAPSNPPPDGPRVVTDVPRRPKHSLSHPDKYDGEDRMAYPAFKGYLRAKLRIDQQAIGDEPELVWYAFGRLTGKAADRIFPWMELMEQRGEPLRVTAFMEQLDAAFCDPQTAQRALEWVNNKQQGRTPFRDFLQEFEQKLLEAGGWEFSDGIRKGYLKAALNLDIKTELVAQAEPDSYAEYVNLVRRTSDNLDEIKRLRGRRKGWGSTPTQPNHPRDADDPMEWEPTPRTSSSRQVKWVSKEVLKDRREKQQCIRCGSGDHFASQCSLGPAVKPDPPRGRSQPKRAAAAERPTPKTERGKTPRPVREEEGEEDSTWSSDDSGNE
jgi:hypothetical protein